MNGKELVEQIKTNEQKINALWKTEKETEAKNHKDTYQLKYEIYGPKIDALQHELNEKLREIETSEKQLVETSRTTTKELNQPLNQAKRIIQFLHLKDVNEKRHPQNFPASKINLDQVIVRQGNYKEDLGFLIDEPYMNIRLMIITNDKPVNGYSLIAMGNTVFFDSFDYPLLNLPQSNKPEQWQNAAYYSGGQYAVGNARIDSTIKTAKSPEELREYAKKHKIFAEFLSEYEKVKAEYETVLKTYSLEDFAELKTEEV